jgi:hypothetical protein
VRIKKGDTMSDHAPLYAIIILVSAIALIVGAAKLIWISAQAIFGF